jgi:hypothetical protein
MIPSGTSRSVYQMCVAATDTEEATTIIAGIFCPDPDHAPPCPVPWESSRMAGGTADFVFYATADQAREILAEVTARGFGNVRLYESASEDGRPIDGSTVIEQFLLERDLPGS